MKLRGRFFNALQHPVIAVTLMTSQYLLVKTSLQPPYPTWDARKSTTKFLIRYDAMTTTAPFSTRIASFGETVFAKYTRLAKEHYAVNLGQGFPDFPPPQFVLDALQHAVTDYQQYAPLPGMPQLNQAVANKMSKALGVELEPTHNIQITVGATEALFACMQALLNPGDEVILFEPFYDAYPADVIMAGGVPKYVPLQPQSDGTWQFDTPHNPTGKTFSKEELEVIIALAHEHNFFIISDEVYEHIAFTPHLSIASLPGGFERTLTISSIGKTFSVTGWKIGWIVAPPQLIHAVRMAHQWIPFAVATPLQVASAKALECAETNDYYTELQTMYQAKRDLLFNALQQTPFKPLEPQGSYFIMADSSALSYKNDVELCEDLPKRIGVGAIPPSAFYSNEHKHFAKHLVRFTFCKTDEALQEAKQRLQVL
jgi:aspartate/methionine/tyrosine aminotransferase